MPWDAEVSVGLNRKIEKWVRDINSVKTELPRSMTLARDSTTATDLHVFADPSIVANCAAVYAVVHQRNSVSQGLITSKSRISKHTTIPRIELVSTLMVANLVQNVKSALKSENVRSVTGWTDGTVVLYWLTEKGNYSLLERVNKIREKEFIKWYYVPTKENPADIGIRGSLIVNISRVWWEGPSWLPDKTKWPNQPLITSTTDSEKNKQTYQRISCNSYSK